MYSSSSGLVEIGALNAIARGIISRDIVMPARVDAGYAPQRVIIKSVALTKSVHTAVTLERRYIHAELFAARDR